MYIAKFVLPASTINACLVSTWWKLQPRIRCNIPVQHPGARDSHRDVASDHTNRRNQLRSPPSLKTFKTQFFTGCTLYHPTSAGLSLLHWRQMQKFYNPIFQPRYCKLALPAIRRLCNLYSLLKKMNGWPFQQLYTKQFFYIRINYEQALTERIKDSGTFSTVCRYSVDDPNLSG